MYCGLISPRFDKSNVRGSSSLEEPKFAIQPTEDKKAVKNMSFAFENSDKNLKITIIGYADLEKERMKK